MRYLSKKNEQELPINREIIDYPISSNIDENYDRLFNLLESCSDAVIKRFTFGLDEDTKAIVVYFDGLADRLEIENNLLRPLMLEMDTLRQSAERKEKDLYNAVKNRILTIAEVDTLTTLQEVCHKISSGDTILLLDGFDTAIAAGTRAWQTRAISTPDAEHVIRGPKEGFTETMRFNTALLRRRIKSTSFKIESYVLGRITKTDTVICYIDGIAPKELVEEVRKRIDKIDVDGVLDTGLIEEYIEDNKYTIFSQAESTEKPDRVVGHLLEGRICIMVDGSPMALIVPTSFPRFLISAEDYYERFVPSTLFRIARFLAFWIALLLPSFYVSVVTYHHEMVPTDLFLTIMAAREGVPFPAFVEAFLMELTFELLREAGLRLPGQIGPAVSIVGALIIGDAAVRAGLVSTPMVVIVAFTGIASFVTPAYNAGIVIRIARFGFLLLAAFLGFFGIMIGLLLLLTRMASLTSLGQPYLAPFAPLRYEQLGDTILRKPWPLHTKRPYLSGMTNLTRKKTDDSNGG